MRLRPGSNPPAPAADEAAPPPVPQERHDGFFAKLLQIGKKTKGRGRPYQPLPASEQDTSLKGENQYDALAAMRRSLMHQQKVKCTGEADGKPCKHFWALTTIVASQNADHLLDGERYKMCTFYHGEPLMFGDGKEDMAVKCNRYAPDDTLEYTPEENKYEPMSPTEIFLVQTGAITTRDQLFERRARIASGEEKDEPEAAAPPEQTVSIDEVLAPSTGAKEPA